ncbi:MAG: DUF2249 domain-containing protein [Thermomicrobiales bacterium]|nr:DUF2249 domain-containing protein [Thermomicrobiales bacterium]MCO5217464.1 DUF2249 domain-containing protein [Thermomicrobiales bacterium]MCO5223946.1 DUF2249 domain-containing protein [Thermomicrobiales bacterium]MCO5226760.1 DUF2249 domain-containing protein [Thermomicrobiales bacterium]
MVTNRPPIEADWKINKVLETYPELLEVLAEMSPAFAKLRNPMIRKVQSRLVTVTQAAGVAGINPAEMLTRLNGAVGHETENTTTITPELVPSAVPDWVADAIIAVELDVRPILARGEEPFGVITEATKGVPVGQALSLRSPFDPVPLRDVLGKQGFEAYSSGAGDDWTTFFLRTREIKPPAAPTVVPAEEAAVTAEITIDVSELVPPEPMIRILAALEELPDGGRLIVHHVRRPMHLYPRLDELGYGHQTIELAPDQIEVVIDKSHAQP